VGGVDCSTDSWYICSLLASLVSQYNTMENYTVNVSNNTFMSLWLARTSMFISKMLGKFRTVLVLLTSAFLAADNWYRSLFDKGGQLLPCHF